MVEKKRAKKMPAKRKMPARRRPATRQSSTVSGMPDGGEVRSRPSTGDDVKAAYDFVKKQKRRTPPS